MGSKSLHVDGGKVLIAVEPIGAGPFQAWLVDIEQRIGRIEFLHEGNRI